MSCEACDGIGLVPYLPMDFPKPDAEAVFADLHFAVCLCSAGQAFRVDKNERHSVAPMWRVWCAREQVDPSRVAMLEDVFDTEELQAAGFIKPPAEFNREAAMLAAGKRKK